jgi:hypothetical protein
MFCWWYDDCGYLDFVCDVWIGFGVWILWVIGCVLVVLGDYVWGVG